SIDYRLSGTAVWPAQIQDCKGAIRWLRANAATYNLDPNRFGVWGSSAGGHLVAHLGASGGVGTVTVGGATVDLEGATGGNLDRSSRVQAVVDWFGPTDLLQMRFHPSGIAHDDPNSPEGRLIGGAVPDNPDLVATVNPITFLSPDDPPFLLMHGTVDNSVPFAQSELLHRALVTRGLRSTFVPILGAGHGGGGFNSQATQDTVNSFWDTHLLNLGAPEISLTADGGEIAENAGTPVTFTISRTGGTAAPLTVRTSLSGTAAVNADYTSSSLQVTLPIGAASGTVTVTPNNDAAIEGNETLVLTLGQSAAYRLAADRTAVAVTIADDESPAGRPTVTIEATDGAASEAGPDAGIFRIERTGGTAANLQVSLRLTGTATSGVDYAAIPTLVTIPSGQAGVDVAVTPIVDNRLETTETAILSIHPTPAYGVGAAATASVRIGERDQASSLPIVSTVAIDFQASEPGANAGAFLVTRTGGTTGGLSANISPAGTAAEGADYATLPLSVFFAPGVNRVTVPVTPLDDADAEGAETVTLRADPAPAVLVGPAGAPVTIYDNDLP
ncbi:MAG TPA: Calx-beta domain-containing protein, partial [Thermoanaerobaculia bacterium]|nr:Calx-beta domain-containing protein [Thermoanaerobaculia bacterium]